MKVKGIKIRRLDKGYTVLVNLYGQYSMTALHGHVDGFERAFSTLEEMLEYVLPLLDTREVNDKS